MVSESRIARDTEQGDRDDLADKIAAVIAECGGLVPASRALGVDKSVLSVARAGGRISRGSTRILRDAIAARAPALPVERRDVGIATGKRSTLEKLRSVAASSARVHAAAAELADAMRALGVERVGSDGTGHFRLGDVSIARDVLVAFVLGDPLDEAIEHQKNFAGSADDARRSASANTKEGNSK